MAKACTIVSFWRSHLHDQSPSNLAGMPIQGLRGGEGGQLSNKDGYCFAATAAALYQSNFSLHYLGAVWPSPSLGCNHILSIGLKDCVVCQTALCFASVCATFNPHDSKPVAAETATHTHAKTPAGVDSNWLTSTTRLNDVVSIFWRREWRFDWQLLQGCGGCLFRAQHRACAGHESHTKSDRQGMCCACQKQTLLHFQHFSAHEPLCDHLSLTTARV